MILRYTIIDIGLNGYLVVTQNSRSNEKDRFIEINSNPVIIRTKLHTIVHNKTPAIISDRKKGVRLLVTYNKKE